MKLNQILKGLDSYTVKGDRYIDISSLSYDSKQVKLGGLFFAIKGENQNGADFIDEAIERGAFCVVSSSDFITYKSITKVIVDDVRKSCAVIADNFYQHPSSKVDIVGITGTNGKTTVLYLILAIMDMAGFKCGSLGTISYNIGERRIPAINTTPSAIMTHMFLHEMEKSGIKNCAMEVSSHSLIQSRVDCIKFQAAIFTNLTKEHLDYHKDMESYFMAKSQLFDMLKPDGIAIVNDDDEYGKRLIKSISKEIITYGMSDAADVNAYDIKTSIKGTCFKVSFNETVFDIKTELIGEYNIYNILAAVSYAIAYKIDTQTISQTISQFSGVPGRLERADTTGCGFEVFIDYAHTDDALSNVLEALKKIAKSKIIVVFGCGGNRDKTKRPRMGKVVSEKSDYFIITSDNPRTESLESIHEDIVKGIPRDFTNYKVCLDRKEAIKEAISMACNDDIVLIAGKGHEKYQIFKDVTLPFDDRQVTEELLEILTSKEKLKSV